MSERRANALHNELEETRTLLEQADRGRRQVKSASTPVLTMTNMAGRRGEVEIGGDESIRISTLTSWCTLMVHIPHMK